MKIAVTGASGFIGGHVTRYFADRGDTVLPIARPFVREPLTRALQGVDTVVHLAGVITAARERDYTIGNVDATRIVAEAARDAGARLVHISSLAAAGPAAAEQPRREEDQPAPVTAYGRSKLESEAAIRAIAGLRWTVLRPGIVYGTGDRALVPLFRMARSGVLPVVGRGSAAYTLVHVADVVRAIAAAVDRTPDGAIVFVGHPEPVTAREMLERVRAAAEGRAPIVRVPRPILWLAAVAGDISDAVGRQPALITTRRFVELTAPGFVCRVDRLREELGVEPAVGLSEGLRESASWYLSQI